MKHLKSTLFTLAALLCSTVASAYSFKVDGIFYNITNNSNLTVEVTYENGQIFNTYKGDVVIPATVTYNDKEYKVTGIGGQAFSESNALTSITIPEGVTSIGSSAFSGCSSLTTITIPENSQLTSIGGYAFSGCSSLTAINIPKGVVYIQFYAFDGCIGLKHLTLSDGTESLSLGDQYFLGGTPNPLFHDCPLEYIYRS